MITLCRITAVVTEWKSRTESFPKEMYTKREGRGRRRMSHHVRSTPVCEARVDENILGVGLLFIERIGGGTRGRSRAVALARSKADPRRRCCMQKRTDMCRGTKLSVAWKHRVQKKIWEAFAGRSDDWSIWGVQCCNVEFEPLTWGLHLRARI